jgi:hypothetical protein
VVPPHDAPLSGWVPHSPSCRPSAPRRPSLRTHQDSYLSDVYDYYVKYLADESQVAGFK